MTRVIKHIAVCLAGISLLIAVPFALAGGFTVFSGGADAVSSASVIIDKPSGSYTVLINRDRHRSESDLAAWHEFFSGGEFTIIFDDIECVTLKGDSGALTLAQSFMSRLPENQMKVTAGDPVLTLSKAENGRFDMMIVSAEAAGRYDITGIYDGKNVDYIAVEDESV